MKRQNSERSLLVTALVGLMFSLLFAIVGLGQAGTSSVRGTVKDPQGNVVPGATVIDVQLEIGNVAETVTVASGTEALVNRDDGSLGNNFINKQITQLPLEARSPLALLTLQPAVTKEGYVAGARTDQSNITLDGV